MYPATCELPPPGRLLVPGWLPVSWYYTWALSCLAQRCLAQRCLAQRCLAQRCPPLQAQLAAVKANIYTGQWTVLLGVSEFTIQYCIVNENDARTHTHTCTASGIYSKLIFWLFQRVTRAVLVLAGGGWWSVGINKEVTVIIRVCLIWCSSLRCCHGCAAEAGLGTGGGGGHVSSAVTLIYAATYLLSFAAQGSLSHWNGLRVNQQQNLMYNSYVLQRQFTLIPQILKNENPV